MIEKLIFLMTAGYVCGSIPFGLIAGRVVKGIDLREYGSHNVGATNVFRVVGKSWGIVVLILDALKGYTAVQLPLWLWGAEWPVPLKIVLGLCAILGHSFSVWLKGKGGKGVATSLGVFLAVTPHATLTAFAFFWIVFAVTRIISVSSLSAALVFPLLVLIFEHGSPGFAWLIATAVSLCAFIFFTHRANIDRLRRGEEKRLI